MSASGEPAGWRAGLHAARANLLPGLVIQAAMLGVLLAYYGWGSARGFFETVARWKLHYGYGFTAVVTAFAGAILPECLRVGLLQRGTIRKQNGQDLLFGIPFWAVMGMCVDLFYRSQTAWFGAGVTGAILLKKIVVDQFIYTPLFGTPVVVWALEWKKRDYALGGFGSMFGAQFLKTVMVPAQLASWAIWIPAVAIVYSLPPPLQIPLFALAESFWSLLITYMLSGAGGGERGAVEALAQPEAA